MISGFIQWGSDIKGGSTDDKHKDWSEIVGFAHGMAQPASATRSLEGGGYESEVVHDPFSVTMRQDCASPKLYEALHNGTHIPKVIIELTRPTGKSPMVYMRYTMTNVSLHSASTSAAATADVNFPVDSFAMDYSTMQWEYTKQDDTGAAKGTVATKVDLTKGAGAS